MEWLDTLDLERALVNCHREMIGDWYRDPWGWPELDWVVKSEPQLLVARLNSEGIRTPAKLDVPKENFATRPAVVIDPLDRLAYQALVDTVSVSLIGDLRSWVYGWRLDRKNTEPGRYADNDDEWDFYRARISGLANRYNFGLTTDVVSFFASIPIDRLCDEILGRTKGLVPEKLVEILQSWTRINGRSGLPQRSVASSALANFYLRPLDGTLEAAAGQVADRDYPATTRWMDDVWIFGANEGRIRRAQLKVEAAIRDLDLNMSAAKTAVREGDDLKSAVRNAEHSAVEAGLNEEPISDDALRKLVIDLTTEPERASRTSIRFATTRVRDHKLWNLIEPFLEPARKMPHGADALARLFRDGNKWRDLEQWYVTYARSPWGSLDWSVGQLGTMFPSSEEGRGIVAEYLATKIGSTPGIQLLALASQRTAAWRPDEARQAIREAADQADHPLDRRILALTAVGLGEERTFVRKLLSEFEQNQVTLRMLQARKFRRLRVKRDFS